MFLKLLASLMFSAAGALIGISTSEKLKENRDICREIGEMLRISAIMIRYRRLNVYDLAVELKSSESLSHLTFLKNLPEKYVQGENFHSLWQIQVEKQNELQNEERKLLSDFGRILGASDAQGQLTSIESLEAELQQLEKKRSDCYLQKGKLYRSVGVLFGVMIGILVI